MNPYCYQTPSFLPPRMETAMVVHAQCFQTSKGLHRELDEAPEQPERRRPIGPRGSVDLGWNECEGRNLG